MADCTVWIIVSQDGQHLLEYDLMLRSILKVPKKKDIKCIVYVYDQESRSACVKKIEEVPDLASVFQFQNIEPPKPELNFYEKSTLTTFFNTYNTKEFKSANNIVIIWGHGSGLGFFYNGHAQNNKIDYLKDVDFSSFDDKDKGLLNISNDFFNFFMDLAVNTSVRDYDLSNFFNTDNIEKTKSTFKEEDKKLVDFIHNVYKRIIEKDPVRFKYHSADQLGGILQSCFPEKVDMLIANSCFVQSIENIIHFKESVKVTVAPQTIFPFLGYDFESFFRQLRLQISGLTEAVFNENDRTALAENLILKFKDKYKNEPFKSILSIYSGPLRPNFLERVSFSAINLQNINNGFVETIEKLGVFIFREMNFFKGNDVNLNEARLKCIDITSNSDDDRNVLKIQIDLTNFLNLYKIELENDNECIKFKEYKDTHTQYTDLLATKDLRLGFLEAPDHRGEPVFLSFFMINTGPLTKEPLKSMAIQTLTNAYAPGTKFQITYPVWTDLLIAWRKKKWQEP